MDREAWEYFENNKRQAVNIDLPEREESEPNIAEEQIEELKALSDGSASTETLKSLGRWQAACAITKLREAKESLSTKLAFEYMEQKERKQKKNNRLLVIGIVFVLFLFCLFSEKAALLVLLLIFSPLILFLFVFHFIFSLMK